MHDSGKHAAEIVELDTKKFRIAKAASELEIESERLESELEMLKERLADLESQGLEGDEATRREREADDATMLVITTARIQIEANGLVDCDSRSFVRWVSISNRMRRATSTGRSFATVAKVMCTLSISIRSSRDSSTQTTSGPRCKDNYDGFCLPGRLLRRSMDWLLLWLEFLYPRAFFHAISFEFFIYAWVSSQGSDHSPRRACNTLDRS